MRIGVVFPQTEIGSDVGAIRAYAGRVEELGYHHVLAYDHVLGADTQVHTDRRGPYDLHTTFHEPFVLFGYLAALTSMELVTGIIILPQRQTALVGRQAADLAILSGNRFRMGIGVGWNWVEYDALGQDFHTRGKRADEQIDLLRRLWTEETVDFAGHHDTVVRAGLPPRPSEPIPIWIGGFGEAAFARCARAGDGFLFGGSTDRVYDGLARLRELVADEGRPVDAVGAESMVFTKQGPADCAARLSRWAEAGGTHGSIVTMGLGLDSADAHIDYVSQVAETLRQG